MNNKNTKNVDVEKENKDLNVEKTKKNISNKNVKEETKNKYDMAYVEKLTNKEVIKILQKFFSYDINKINLSFINRCNKLVLDILNKKIDLLKTFTQLKVDTYRNPGIFSDTTKNKRYNGFIFEFNMVPTNIYWIFKEDYNYFYKCFNNKGVDLEIKEVKDKSLKDAANQANEYLPNVSLDITEETTETFDKGGTPLG